MFWSSRKDSELSYRYENVYLHPTAEVAEGVEIGPFSYVGPSCRIGKGCRLHNSVTLAENTVLGEGNEVFPGAVLGATPQDKKYVGEESRVIVGDRNSIREGVTIHGGTSRGGGCTRIGSDNLLMANCHVAHDCVIEDNVVVANGVLLGGHVKVEQHAAFGGLAAVHHFVTVGRYAFVGGLARVTQDVPPFLLAEGHPAKVRAINSVGLRRHGFPTATLHALRRAHCRLFREGGSREEILRQLRATFASNAEVLLLVAALEASARGCQGRAREQSSAPPNPRSVPR